MADWSIEESAYLDKRSPVSLNTARLHLNERTLRLLIPLAVFVLALLPRILNLDVFITADEDDQIMFASHFLNSILQGNWSNALVLGYPGVPTLILGAGGVALRYLFHYAGWYVIPWVDADFFTTLQQTTARFGQFEQPLDFLVWVRTPLAITASLSILAVFLLVRRLVNQPVALLAALILAFDPFILAHSRVIHVDAPMAYFMFLSFLAFLLFLDQGGGRWLILSGLFGGLAALSKTPAIIVGPILVISGMLYALLPPPDVERRTRRRRLAVALVVWGLIAAGAVFALWPSMWSDPLGALQFLYRNIEDVSSTAHPTSGIFWGDQPSDQSSFYYLMAFPYHLTPLTTVGLLAGLGLIVAGLAGWWRKSYNFAAQVLPLALSLLGYVVIFIAPVSTVARRGDRYILPVYFAVGLLAALALWWLTTLITERWPMLQQRLHLSAGRLLGGLLAVQIVSVLLYHPYYLAYFNPLIAGPWSAPSRINVGWGEGLDVAARYLNRTQIDKAPAAAWYSNQFAPFYQGPTIDLSSYEAALTAPYTVFYINQVQRGFPSREILHYFRQREPEHVVHLGGIEYAWIYPGPVIGQSPASDFNTPAEAVLGGKVRLYGVNLPHTEFPVDRFAVGRRDNQFAGPYLRYKETLKGLPVTLHWETLGALPGSEGKLNAYIRLLDDAGNVWGQVDRLVVGGLWRANRWQPGYFLRDEYKLPIDPATPPGEYHLEVGLYNFETNQNLGVAKNIGRLTLLPPETPAKADDLQLPTAVNQPIDSKNNEKNELTLLGHTYADTHLPPGAEISGKIFWQANIAAPQSRELEFSFMGPDGKYILHEQEPLANANAYPMAAWRQGEPVGQAYRFRIPAVAPPGAYQMQVAVIDPATGQPVGQPVTLANITVTPQQRNFSLPADVTPLSAVVADNIELVGYKLHNAIVAPDQTFGLTLYWRSLDFAEANYTVFVHVVGPDQSIRGQWDSVPAQGASPTSGWLPGEIIEDHYQIPLNSDAPPWKYDIFVGMYDPLTGQRLPLFSAQAPTSNDRVWLTRIQAVDSP